MSIQKIKVLVEEKSGRFQKQKFIFNADEYVKKKLQVLGALEKLLHLLLKRTCIQFF